MYKVVFGLKRKSGLTQEQFRDFWLDDHAPKVAKLPGLRKYVVDIALDANEERVADGYAVLWFDSAEAFRAAFGSEYARTVVLPNNQHFNDMDNVTRVAVEEHVILA